MSVIRIDANGYPTDDFLIRRVTMPESPSACLWDAMGHLCVELHSNPESKPIQAAIWQIQEAILKIHVGEDFETTLERIAIKNRVKELMDAAGGPGPAGLAEPEGTWLRGIDR